MFQPLYLSTAVIEMCIYSRRKLRVTGIYGKPFKNRKNFCPKSELLKMWWNLIPRDSLEKSLSDPKWRNTWNQKCGDIFPNLCLSLFCLFCFDLSDFVLVFEREGPSHSSSPHSYSPSYGPMFEQTPRCLPPFNELFERIFKYLIFDRYL